MQSEFAIGNGAAVHSNERTAAYACRSTLSAVCGPNAIEANRLQFVLDRNMNIPRSSIQASDGFYLVTCTRPDVEVCLRGLLNRLAGELIEWNAILVSGLHGQ